MRETHSRPGTLSRNLEDMEKRMKSKPDSETWMNPWSWNLRRRGKRESDTISNGRDKWWEFLKTGQDIKQKIWESLRTSSMINTKFTPIIIIAKLPKKKWAKEKFLKQLEGQKGELSSHDLKIILTVDFSALKQC